MFHHPSRRRLLGAALALTTCGTRAFSRTPGFGSDPFTLGVASGWPTPTRISLWTRLAPDPWATDGGMEPAPVAVAVEVAEDEGFRRIVATKATTAVAELAHSVHVDVSGLLPGRGYFYRFHAGDATSPVGRTRTAPAVDAIVDRLRFAIGSCQHMEGGWYSAYRHLADEDLDLMVFLGDYIYEHGAGLNPDRRYTGIEVFTLSEYRIRHAETKADPDLQRFHGLVPWMLVWDDHEVDNDWAADLSEDGDPDFMARRDAAFQAYFEHMPIPLEQAPGPTEIRLYGEATFGDLARFHLLDCRQYRSPHACPGPRGAGSTVLDEGTCAELADPSRTMLGAAQEDWLTRTLAQRGPTWNVVAQSTLVSPLDMVPTTPGTQIWTDPWSGYPEARRRLLGSLQRAANPVVVGGDMHGTYISDLRLDPAAPAVATEFCGTSITTGGLTEAESDARHAANPHLTFVNGHDWGYVAFELTPSRMTARVRKVDTTSREGLAETLATFVVDDGVRSAVRT